MRETKNETLGVGIASRNLTNEGKFPYMYIIMNSTVLPGYRITIQTYKLITNMYLTP